jgi:hypothetical protein
VEWRVGRLDAAAPSHVDVLRRRGLDVLPVTLTKDGRLANEVQLERVAKAAGSATDCFIFCHSWLYHEGEARQETARFFALLDGALASLRGARRSTAGGAALALEAVRGS